MKRTINILILAATLLTSTSCLKEVLPQTSGATASQVASADKISFVNGLLQFINSPYPSNFMSAGAYTAIGYPEHIIWHDVMTSTMPMRPTAYNYWTYYSHCLYMGDYAPQTYFFRFYNKIIYMASSVVRVCDKENEADAFYLANGCAMRAHFNLEMTRMYEFKNTNTSLDATYYSKLKGLTIPIVNEFTTEQQAMNNPRAPFYKMYRYILGDLNTALAAIRRSKTEAPAKNYVSEGMVLGTLARFWLEVGTRFERYSDDLDEQKLHDSEQWEDMGEGYQDLPPLGVDNAAEAFAKAAEYARAAIDCGYSPVTQSQWYDKATGFNTANQAWIWSIQMSPNDYFVAEGDWISWTSFMSPEAGYGIAGDETYCAQFMIDALLFSTIPDSDWRKRTWIDPEDMPSKWNRVTEEQEAVIKATFNSKYASLTNLDYESWKKCYPHVGFKFHPGSGNTEVSTTGNLVAIPLMRVEEMYLIEAEAIYKSQGDAAGKLALETFVKTYRDPNYSCTADSKREFEQEIVRQKSIEFWGEGVTLFDYKRLEMSIDRTYTKANAPVDTNHESASQFKSHEGSVAPWTILFIPIAERTQNPALILNPDPTNVSKKLK